MVLPCTPSTVNSSEKSYGGISGRSTSWELEDDINDVSISCIPVPSTMPFAINTMRLATLFEVQ